MFFYNNKTINFELQWAGLDISKCGIFEFVQDFYSIRCNVSLMIFLSLKFIS